MTTPTQPDPKLLLAARWAFAHFYHADKANAVMHCASVRFSPITFRLADALFEHMDVPDEALIEVNYDKGRYQEDPGR